MNSNRIEQLKTLIADSPDDPFLHYALALEHVDEMPEIARNIFNVLLKDHPDYLPAYYHAAQLYWSMGYESEARSSFENGINLARKLKDANTLRELENAYLNFQFEVG
ncbi:tetratricopeptide repeat protein [Fulvivirga sedimenti]|uniref:Tetratricopeptide repeat protein n=1 Tax=Fulvivirga sedimenti TaxID=2879465 RepID=A0A9X1HJS3_9BACT|nr:tetratricopeptide repeat protein [Fulvivirga sedimenti]MCA6073365.1 tetratricopeptide repeat protein [Fulvivirga sedimenti]